MVKLVNRAKMSTATTGTGTITLGSAVDGFQTFAAAGVANADTVRYAIEDGFAWEIGTGTYTATGTTLTRTVIESSNSDAPINLSGNALVFLTVAGGDLQHAADMDQGVTTTDSPSFAGLAVDTNTLFVDAANNRVGVGTTSPSFELDVVGVTDPSIRVRATGAGSGDDALFRMSVGNSDASNYVQFGDNSDIDAGYIRYQHANDSLQIGVNAAERMRIDSAGNVGIGTNAPGGNLHVQGAIGNQVRLYLTDGDSTGVGNSLLIGKSGASSFVLDRQSGSSLWFGTADTEHMRITSAGRVGVGTTAPSTAFHAVGGSTLESFINLTGTSPALNITETDDGALHRIIADGGNLFIQADGTGSVSDSGNLYITGRIGADLSLLAIRSDLVTIDSNGTERMRITDIGRVGIGTASPASNLDVVSAIRASNPTGSAAVFIEDGASSFTENRLLGIFNDNGLRLQTRTDAGVFVSNDYLVETNATGASAHRWQIANTERMRIDSNGRLGIGTSSPATSLDVSGGVAAAEILRTGSRDAISVPDHGGTNRVPPLMISGSTFATTIPSVAFYNTTADAGTFNFLRSNTTTVGNHALVSNNNNMGTLQWAASDGVNFRRAAQIQGRVDGTPAENDMPGRLVFLTTPSGSTAPTERMRITSAGNVGIGTTTPSVPLSVVGSAAATRGLALGTAGVDATAYISQFRSTVETVMGPLTTRQLFGTVSNHDVAFLTNNTETMRLTATGRLGIGTSSPQSTLDLVEIAPIFGDTRSANTNKNWRPMVPIYTSDGTSDFFSPFFISAGVGFNRITIGGGTATAFAATEIRFFTAANETTTTGTERMRITSAGNVLIGTTSDGASKLRVVGLPTSSAGLSAGDIWNDGGTLKIV